MLAARIDSLGWLDRALLACGGRRWMRRMFAETLVPLADGTILRAPSPLELD